MSRKSDRKSEVNSRKNKVKDVYLSTNLEELNKMVETGNIKITKSNFINMIKSAGQIQIQADQSFNDGDEEKAYIMYMRYYNLIKLLKDSKSFTENQKYFNEMLTALKIKQSVSRAGELLNSLDKRYSLLNEINHLELKDQKDEEVDRVNHNNNDKNRSSNKGNKSNPVNHHNNSNNTDSIKDTSKLKLKDESKSMDILKLKNLIEQKCASILIMDCRGGSDFVSNRLDYSKCISIPSEILTPGITMLKISEKLKENYPESYMVWEQNQKNPKLFDKIILYDWNTSFNEDLFGDSNSANSPSPIVTLYHALTKWNPHFLSRTITQLPLILEGGYRHICYSYPGLLVNARYDLTSIPSSDKKPLTISKMEIEDIQYPFEDLEEKERLNNSNKENKNIQQQQEAAERNSLPKINNIPNGIGIGMPNVDRTSKPATTTTTVIVNDLKNGLDKENNGENGVSETAMDVDIESNDVGDGHGLDIYNKELKSSNVNIVVSENGISNNDDKLKSKPSVNNIVPTIPTQIQPVTVIPPTPVTPAPSVINNNTSNELKSNSTRNNGINARDKMLRMTTNDNNNTPMKRSHSHPNIAQSISMEEEEEQIAKKVNYPPNSGQMLPRNSKSNETTSPIPTISTPNFNRSLKPSPSANSPSFFSSHQFNREFHIVSTTDKNCQTGLRNLGNTCYMNSIMQCLYHTVHLRNFFISNDFNAWQKSRNISTSNKRVHNITQEFSVAIREMNKGHRSIGLPNLKNSIGLNYSDFRGCDQQDSHELLIKLLEWMHEEMNTSPKAPKISQKDNDEIFDKLSDIDGAEYAWKMYKTYNSSIISELFSGQQKSCLKCGNCGKRSLSFEIFQSLTVPIPSTSNYSNKRVSIHECLDLYTREEEVQDWKCKHCKHQGKAIKKIDLLKLPLHLIIHLNRFYNDGWCKKRLSEVEFPLENLDLTKRCLLNSPYPFTYDLYGISNHYGTMDGGHYTAYCRSSKSWYKFDDLEVSAISPNYVCTSAAYILFYSNNSSKFK